MTSLQAKLTQDLAKRLTKKTVLFQQGFTLVELLIVIAIVGILSAVALPQFFGQTKKAAATEGTQQASSIAKQAAAYYLERGDLGDVDETCETYAGVIKTDNLKFAYSCSGSAEEFEVRANGIDDNANTKDVVVTITANLTDGTFSQPDINLAAAGDATE